MLKTINRSILEHRVVEISYKPLGQDRASKRQIHPYGIAFYHGSLYVIADACEAKRSENLRGTPASRPDWVSTCATGDQLSGS